MAAPDWAPTPDQVAALLRAYTRGAESASEDVPAGEVGSFTDQTRPSVRQVEEIIALACGEVTGMFGGRQPCTDDLRDSARTAALYRACQLVCVSYFPESTRGDGNAFDALGRLYDPASRGVAAGVAARCPLDPDDPSDDGGSLAPAGRGRDPRYPVLGFGHPW